MKSESNNLVIAPGETGRQRSVLRWIAISTGALIAVAVLGLLVFTTFAIPLDLSWSRDRIETAATEALNRRVVVDGEIELIPALWPTLEINGVRIGNPGDWSDADFVVLDRVRVKVGVIPILRGEIRIEEITVDGLTVALEVDAKGRGNWLIDRLGGEAESVRVETAMDLRFVELQQLSLNDVAVTYRSAVGDTVSALELTEVSGNVENDQPMRFSIQGAVQDVPFTVTVGADSFATLIDDGSEWHVDTSVEAAGTKLTIIGDVTDPLKAKGLALEFTLTSDDMMEFEALSARQLPPIRSFNIRGRINESDGAYRVESLSGEIGRTKFTGELEVDTSGARLRLLGAIDVPRIDAGFLASAVYATESRASANTAPAVSGEPIDIDKPILNFVALSSFDADLTLVIREIVNADTSVRDASLNVSVKGGVLTAPIEATVADVPFNGELRLALQDGAAATSIFLQANESDIGTLLELVTGIQGIEGSFDIAKVEMSTYGDTIRSLGATTELHFLIEGGDLSYGHSSGEGPIEFTLETFEVMFPAADVSSITAKGTLLQKPFALEVSGGTFIENYIKNNWPISLTASGSGATLTVTGTGESTNQQSGAALAFSVSGERVGDLANWVGVSPSAQSSYALNGMVNATEGSLIARIDEARVGNSLFAGQVGRVTRDGRSVTVLELAFEAIDSVELTGLFPEGPANVKPKSEQPFSIDIPILPSNLNLSDSDIAVSIDRISMRSSQIDDVSFASEMRDGRVENAPLHAIVAGTPVDGNMAIDLSGGVPEFDINVTSENLQVGELLTQLGITEDAILTAEEFNLNLALRGATIRTMMERSRFSAGIRNGMWRLRDPNTSGSIAIHIRSGTVEAPVGAPIALDLDGLIRDIPITIAVRTDSLASFATAKTSLQARLEAQFLGADLSFAGTSALPINSQNLQFALDFSGDRVSDLDALIGVSLPPWRDYKLSGEFGSNESGYYIEDLQFGVGSSILTGAMELDTTQGPPQLEIRIAAPSIQLNDFEVDDWSMSPDGSDQTTSVNGEPSEENAAGLLSPQVLRALNGTFSVRVNEVLSGTDPLGSGELMASLTNGRLAIEQLSINVPGGNVSLGVAYEPTETNIKLEVRAAIDQFDYGVLARRIDPQSTTGGLISFDVDLTADAPKNSSIMAKSEGHINFAVWPEDLNAGIFDLWAVNLLTSVLPSLDSEASKVNCVIAKFALDDGIMRPTSILIDTSRIQASGDGTINFRDKTIDFATAPKPKRPKMFSAQTPIGIEGELTDFSVGPASGAMAGTVLRMITSPVVVPFQWTFSGKQSQDGEVACQNAWGQ